VRQGGERRDSVARFDGEGWTFAYRSQSSFFSCCYSCDYSRPDLVTVRCVEHIPGPFFSPFARTEQEARLQAGVDLPSVTLAVSMEPDGSEGELTLRGTGGSAFFSCRLAVGWPASGGRQLRHRANVTGPLGGAQLHDYLFAGDGGGLLSRLALCLLSPLSPLRRAGLPPSPRPERVH
jgi:hypothetical protein